MIVCGFNNVLLLLDANVVRTLQFPDDRETPSPPEQSPKNGNTSSMVRNSNSPDEVEMAAKLHRHAAGTKYLIHAFAFKLFIKFI